MGNLNSARTLLQRGVRCNPSEPKLYIENLKLECITLFKMASAKIVADNENPEPVPAAVPIVICRHALRRLEAGKPVFLQEALDICDKLMATPEAAHITQLDVWREVLLSG